MILYDYTIVTSPPPGDSPYIAINHLDKKGEVVHRVVDIYGVEDHHLNIAKVIIEALKKEAPYFCGRGCTL